MSDGRRWKLFLIGDSTLLGLFQPQPPMNGMREGDVIQSFQPVPLPASAKIERVFYEFHFQALAVVISDKSFDPVPDGESIPIIDIEIHTRAFRLVDVKEGLYKLFTWG